MYTTAVMFARLFYYLSDPDINTKNLYW